MFKSKPYHKNRFLKKRWLLGYFPVEIFDGLKRQQLISKGTALTLVLLALPIIIWLAYTPDSIQDPLIALAKFNAFMAISTLSLNFFISTRLKSLEYLFNGLDRMYRVHKVVGRSSLLFILLHPLFLIVFNYPNVETIKTFLLPIGTIEISAGVIAVYLFLLLLTLTVAIKIPYHWWHKSHRLLGYVLIFALFHAIFAGSDIRSYPALRFWIIFIGSLGVVSWIYMTFFYRRLGPRFKVTIEKINHLQDITEIQFKRPKKFTFQPGQYLFIRFPRFEGYKELFPFSISSEPSEEMVRICVKQSGDYTSEKIPLLKTGDTAIVMGPYGRFGTQYTTHDKDMLWIAGGIGITPFLSMAKHESRNPTKRKISLIWVVKTHTDTKYDEELQEESRKNKHFNYSSWISYEKGKITASTIQNILGEHNLKNKMIYLCGPPGLTYSLSHQLHRIGVPYHHIIFEDFNMLD